MSEEHAQNDVEKTGDYEQKHPSLPDESEQLEDHHSAPRLPQNGTAQERPDIIRTLSTQSRSVSVKKVPRSKRAGLFGRFTLVYEAEKPHNYPRSLKWTITFWIALAAIAAPMGSAIILRRYFLTCISIAPRSLTDYVAALHDITREFDTTPFITNLSIALYMLSMSIFPLWWSSFSETAGRRTIYIISFSLYAVFNVLAAESTSIGMFIAMRVLGGGSSAAVQAVGAGTIADVWEVKERGRAMGIFYLGPLCGPLLAPVIGGALTQGLGWRSTQWFQVIYGAFMLLALILFLPETHKTYSPIVAAAEQEVVERTIDASEKSSRPTSIHPSLSRVASRQSVALNTRKWVSVLRRTLIDPLKIIFYLQYPAVALTVYYASIAFGSLYFLNISVEITFSAPPYNFSTIIIGVLYCFNSAGYILASLLGGPWVDYIMHREAKRAGRVDDKGKLIFRPEDRMRENMWIAAFIMPIALIWYGWTSEKGVFFVAPMIANFFFGAGSMLIFAAATTMLTEFMPKNASNGVALNNFVRNIFSFVGALTAEPAVKAIGNGWLFTIIGIVALMSCGVIVAMRRWGDKWREDMDRRMK